MAITKITTPELFNLQSNNTEGTQLPVMTTTEREAMTGMSNGELIFNSTTDSVEYYDLGATAWYKITSEAKADIDIFSDNSCIAYYRFNGNADDETGNYNATASNETYSATGGKQGGYIQLPQNKSGKIDTNDSGFLSPHGGVVNPSVSRQVRSYSMWIQFGVSGAAEYILSQWRSSPTPRSTAFYVQKQANNTLNITMYGSNNSNNYSQWTTSTPYTYNLNTWYNIVFSIDTNTVYNSASRFQVWINSVSQSVNFSNGTTPAPTIQNVSTPNTVIGSLFNAGQGAYAKFDEFRVFNRVLTNTEAGTLYAEF
jgi:hypothetical protein